MNEFNISDPLLRRIVVAIGIMGTIAFGFYTFGLLKNHILLVLNILTPFIAAFLLAYILAPIVIALQQQLKLGRIMGTLILYMMIFTVFFGILGFLIPKFITQLIRLFQVIKTTLPPLIAELAQNDYLKLDAELIHKVRAYIENMELDLEGILSSTLPGLKNVATGSLSAFGKATKGIFTGVGSVFGFFSFLAFVGIINFYIILDWEKIRPIVRKMVDPESRQRVFGVLEKIDIAVGGFLRGQITVSIIVGSMFATGLFAMGFIGFPALRNYCVLIGVAAAIGGFVPYLGALIGVTPAILIILLTGGVDWSVKIISLISVLILFAIIQAVEGFILQPRIVGKGAGLHPLIVMLALIAGAQFGIGGMIIAVPLASIIRVIVREFYWLPIEQREAAMTEAPL